MVDRDANPATLLRSLANTTTSIAAAAEHLSPGQLQMPATPGSWSPNQILWHVRAQADVYGEHIRRIVNEETPRWRHVSPRARMKKTDYDQLPFAKSFADFAQQRRALLALLEGVAPDAWQRVALVRVGERETRLTLQERVWGMAQHEQAHCVQLAESVEALRTATIPSDDRG